MEAGAEGRGWRQGLKGRVEAGAEGEGGGRGAEGEGGRRNVCI